MRAPFLLQFGSVLVVVVRQLGPAKALQTVDYVSVGSVDSVLEDELDVILLIGGVHSTIIIIVIVLLRVFV